MIHPETHTATWLTELRKKYPGKDPILLEKCVNALCLAEQLKLAGLEFIFKGGTSLVLLFEEIKRLSIDLDIIVETEEPAIETVLDRVMMQGLFKRYEKNPYPRINNLPIKSKILKTRGDETMVRVPTVDSILGDKFATIAPNTVGIPFNGKKDLDIGKQLFDLEILFDAMTDIKTVRKSFFQICEQEIPYRTHKKITPDEVIQDSFDAFLTLAFQGKRNPEIYEAFLTAVGKVGSYGMLEKKYQLVDAIRTSGKIAYLASLLKSDVQKVERYDPVNFDLKKLSIEIPEYNRLNRVRRATREGFFYWYQAIENF